MKMKYALTLITLGAIWFFLRQNRQKQVLLGQAGEYAFPDPGIYVARLTPLEPIIAKPTITPIEIPKEEVKVKDIADIMEAIVEKSKMSL